MSDADAGEIRPVNFTDALGERYLAYALSTIMSRSLPDVRDGLKPVHRRLIFAMRELGLDPAAAYKKCARVVGDVMGKYHPHGDASIYEAMVRLAQEFAVRWPLVEGHGNFGNIDGDNAAAMRYTEARMTAVAEAMLEGIDEDTVDFRATYDGEGREPVVLPGAFPNLLANGSQGIAVGMATNIPPHNVAEICDALVHLIRHPAATTAKLIGIVRGPDFPTGGILVEDAATIAQAYETGRGALRVRARWTTEDLGRGTWQVVVTEIPYQVPKARLIERLAELIENRKALLLGDVRDESTDEIRLVLVPRARTVEPDALMESLFRQTDLETRFNMNMNVLDADGVPRVMPLRDMLAAFLAHRQEVLQRRSRFRLEKIAHRLEVLAGYLIAYLNIDEVIRIIRFEDEPKAVMIATFGLTDVQAEAILNMRLRALRKLEEIEIRREHDALSAEQAELNDLLADEAKQWLAIEGQLKSLRETFGPKTKLGRRRTEIAGAPAAVEISLESVIEREPVTVLLSDKGWIRAMKGHLAPDAEVKYKEGDSERFRLHAQTTDKLLVVSAGGRVFTIGADKLPGGRGMGEPLRLMADLANDDEVVTLRLHRPDGKLILASSDGRGFQVAENDIVAQTRAGKQVMNLAPGAKLKICTPVVGDLVAVMGENRRLLVFPLDELPEMTRGRGVTLQKYRTGSLDDLASITAAEGLTWQSGDRQRREIDLTRWLGRRAGAGHMPPHGFPKSKPFG
ncbi:topoisomerase-4 subunit A [Constrictibacter sp. MBR-5]|jgi:topoisomerase-4 subunit A|uniref:DNA topoisomerase IV subunit A n=1 Tax=Constrictibacter sp. MBR-5 TaxID=3156467 RepID=UPI00339452ED